MCEDSHETAYNPSCREIGFKQNTPEQFDKYLKHFWVASEIFLGLCGLNLDSNVNFMIKPIYLGQNLVMYKYYVLLLHQNRIF